MHNEILLKQWLASKQGYELSPYFKALDKQKPICRSCGAPGCRYLPSVFSWDGAYLYCPTCHDWHSVSAPKDACLGQRKKEFKGKIIMFKKD